MLKDIRKDSWGKKDNKINIYNYYNNRSHALTVGTKWSRRVEQKGM